MRCASIVLVLAAACGGSGGGGDDGSMTQPPDGATPTIDAPVVVDAATPPRETLMMVKSLQPGELIEAAMNGGANDRAVLHLMAPTATLDWNIHAHPAGGVITVHEELKVMSAEYDFVPTEQAEWYLLLRNHGQATMDVQVKVELYGAMTFEFL
jgi:hypothetical protein